MNDKYPMGCVYASPEIMDTRSQITRSSLILESGDTIALVKTSISIGRNSSCDVVIDNSSVSRNHAHLHNHLGQWFLCDDGSANGTQINNIPVLSGKQYALHDGDVILLARMITLIFKEQSTGFKQDDSYPFIHAKPIRISAEDYEAPPMQCVYASPQMMEREQRMSFWAKLFKRNLKG